MHICHLVIEMKHQSMLLTRVYILVLFTHVVIHSAFSQPVIINNLSRHYMQPVGSEDQTTTNPAGRRMIREYATALATNPVNISISFQCEINHDVNVTAGGDLSIRFRINNSSIRGNHMLKGFDISNALLPSLFYSTIFISGSKGDTLLHDRLHSARLIHGKSDYFRYKVTLPDDADTIWIEVKDLFFFHNDQNVRRLIERLQKIADYYAADYLLKGIERDFAAVNCRQADLLPSCFLALIKADRELQHIDKASFEGFLSLGYSDPAELKKKFEILSYTYSFLMRELSTAIQLTQRIDLNHDFDQFIEDYLEGITWYIDDNPEPGFAATPFINQLASIEYTGGTFQQKAHLFRQLAAKARPGVPAGEASGQKLAMVYHAMIYKAKEYIDAIQFNKAIVLLENAGRFCEAFREIDCSHEASFELAKAKHGLYDFYLSVASRAIEIEKPDIAHTYVFRALDFQRDNHHLIIYDGKVTDMIARLFDAYVWEAEKFNQVARYDSALIYVNRAIQPGMTITPTPAWQNQKHLALNGLLAGKLNYFDKALKSLPLTITENMYHQLDQFIGQDMMGVDLNTGNRENLTHLQMALIRQLTNAAKSDINENYFDEAMRKVILAHSIPESHKFRIRQQLDTLALISGREIIHAMLIKTIALINQGKTDEGFEAYSKALQQSKEFGLDDDEMTKNRFNKIYEAYLAIRCSQLQSYLNQALLRSERLAGIKLFTNAYDTVSAALEHVQTFPACRHSLKNAEKFLIEFEVAANFQRSVRKAGIALEQNEYNECLSHLRNARKLNESHDLKKFGLNPFSMYLFAKDKNDQTLNYHIARHLIQSSQHDQALAMLELMRKSGVSSSNARSLQRQLGADMGAADRNSVGSFRSFSKPKEYTGGHAWYKSFNRAYRRGLGYSFPWIF
jgi:tetratricopeptide (TPR) repeat protein